MVSPKIQKLTIGDFEGEKVNQTERSSRKDFKSRQMCIGARVKKKKGKEGL